MILLPHPVDNPESFDTKKGYRIRTTHPTVVIDDEGYIVKTFTMITHEKMIEEIILQENNE